MKSKLSISHAFAAAAFLLCNTVASAATVTLGEIKTGGIVTLIGFPGFTLDNSTGLDFLNQFEPTAADGSLIGAAGSGLFNNINCTSSVDVPTCGTIKDILNFNNFAGSSSFLTIGGVIFSLDAPLLIQRNAESTLRLAGLTVSGSGFASFDGLLMPAKFTLNTQGTETTNTSYAASLVVTRTDAPIPEPASVLLVGLGIAGVIAARRKKA